MTLLLVLVSAFITALLVPDTLALGFAGDDWYHIFSHMGEEQSLWQNFLESWEHYLALHRPTPMQPLALVTLFELFGEDPTGYFACGLAAFAVAAVLIGRLVYRLTGSELGALAGTVVWLTVPIHAQPLFMMSAGLGKWQGAIYFVLSLFCYFNYLQWQRHRWFWVLGSSFFFALTLGCYEQAVTFLAAYPVVHWLWAKDRLPRRLYAGAFWVHVIVAMAYVYVRTGVLSASNPGAYHINSFADFFSDATLAKMRYVDQFYDHIPAAYADYMALISLTGIALVVGIIGLSKWLVLRRDRPAATGGSLRSSFKLILLGVVVFLSGHAIYYVVSTGIDERSLAFPSIGLAVAIASAIAVLHASVRHTRASAIKTVLETVLLAVVSVSGTLMFLRTERTSEPYKLAGKITSTVFAELREKGKAIPPKSDVVVFGTPWLAMERTWVFTADYSMTGCVVRALWRPRHPRVPFGRMAIVPSKDTYNCRVNIRNYAFGGYCHNYYTDIDDPTRAKGTPAGPFPDYDQLSMFLFDGTQLHRVKELHFQDADAKWHTKTLATEASASEADSEVAFRLPRIAKVVGEAEAATGQLQPDLRAGPFTLLRFGLEKSPHLMETYKTTLVWKRASGPFPKGACTVAVHFRDGKEAVLFSYGFQLEEAELARQLENRPWEADLVLQQDLLLNRQTVTPLAELIEATARIEFVLHYTGDAETETLSATKSFENPY